jgi:hypothetical protein
VTLPPIALNFFADSSTRFHGTCGIGIARAKKTRGTTEVAGALEQRVFRADHTAVNAKSPAYRVGFRQLVPESGLAVYDADFPRLPLDSGTLIGGNALAQVVGQRLVESNTL